MTNGISEEKHTPYLCASYARLSQDDGSKEESNSITSQRYLIRDYISAHPELRLVQEYADDGYSGVDFNRPGFEAMMADIKRGQINCIIVKDLSRFGRNYIETGRYLEEIFPFLGIRFIAINDHVDTGRAQTNAEQFVLPFKNLINDAYCKDISQKVRTQLAVKRKKGDYVGSFACYGYAKDPADHNHLIVDPEAAQIVRQIYDWKVWGLSAEKIAGRLNEMGILSPLEYKLSNGLQVSTNFRQHDMAQWTPGTILRILKNELYTGVMVQGKITTPSYKIKQKITKAHSDWDRVEGTHEAIVPKELFRIVQTMLLQDTRTSPYADRVYLFSGFLFCGDCRRNMTRRLRRYKDREYAYYCCVGYRRKTGCTSHIISEKKLYEAVLSAIRQQFLLIEDLEQLLKHVQELPTEQILYRQFEPRLARLEEQIRRNREMKHRLAENLNNGILSREEYVELGALYEERIRRDRLAQRALEAEWVSFNSAQTETNWLAVFRSHPNIETLDRPLLAELISRIEVHSDKQITVHFRFQDQVRRAIRYLNLLDLDTPDKQKPSIEEDTT